MFGSSKSIRMQSVKYFMSGAAISCTLLVCAPAFAGMFGGLGGVVPGISSSSSTVSTDDLEHNLSGLDVRFATSMREMLTAQSLTASALGNKARADELSSEAKSLEGKNDLNTIARSIKVSEEAAKENGMKMKKAGSLNSQAKAVLASAAVHYGLGIAQASQLPTEYGKWLGKAQGAANSIKSNPAQALGAASFLGDVKDVGNVTGDLPDLISAWYDSTKGFLKFARGNSVDTGDLASKI